MHVSLMYLLPFVYNLPKGFVGKNPCVSVYSSEGECYIAAQKCPMNSSSVNFKLGCGGIFHIQTDDGSGPPNLQRDVRFPSSRICTKDDCLEPKDVSIACSKSSTTNAPSIGPNTTIVDHENSQPNNAATTYIALGVTIAVFILLFIGIFFLKKRRKGSDASRCFKSFLSLKTSGPAAQDSTERREENEETPLDDAGRQIDPDERHPEDEDNHSNDVMLEIIPEERPSEDEHSSALSLPQEETLTGSYSDLINGSQGNPPLKHFREV